MRTRGVREESFRVRFNRSVGNTYESMVTVVCDLEVSPCRLERVLYEARLGQLWIGDNDERALREE